MDVNRKPLSRIIENEFPGVINIDLEKAPNHNYAIYQLNTTAQTQRIRKWIQLMMVETGMDIRTDYHIYVNNQTIRIKKPDAVRAFWFSMRFIKVSIMSFPSLPKSIFTFAFIIMAAWSAISHSAHANSVILFPDQSASLSWMNQKATDVMASRLSKAGYMIKDTSTVMNRIGITTQESVNLFLQNLMLSGQRLVMVLLFSLNMMNGWNPGMRSLSLRLAAHIYTTSNGFVSSWVEPSQTILIPEQL